MSPREKKYYSKFTIENVVRPLTLAALFFFYLFSFYLLYNNKKPCYMYCVRLTETCYSTCISLLFVGLIASIVLICMSLNVNVKFL